MEHNFVDLMLGAEEGLHSSLTTVQIKCRTSDNTSGTVTKCSVSFCCISGSLLDCRFRLRLEETELSASRDTLSSSEHKRHIVYCMRAYTDLVQTGVKYRQVR